MEEVIGSIPIRSTNQAANLAEIIESARYAFDTLVLMLHLSQDFLSKSENGPEEYPSPGSAPLFWLA
jgi:hypothetical protein